MTLTYQDEITIDKIVSKKIKPIEKKIDRVLVVLDKFAGNVKSMQEELAVVQGHRDQLENHETRLSKIETKLDLSY